MPPGLIIFFVYIILEWQAGLSRQRRRARVEDRIRTVLKEKVDPLLASHYGGILLVGYENGVAKVRLTGGCAGCPSAQYTVEDVVKTTLMDEIPEVEDVVLDTSVSEDLLDMARKILRKEVQ